MFPYAGKILKIDLEKKTTSTIPTDTYSKLFVGGRGINIAMLYDSWFKGMTAFDAETPLIFGTGILNGTLSPAAARFSVSSVGPLTGIFADASAGGYFGPMMKMAGYDNIYITGISKKPVIIDILDDEVIFHDAKDQWGLGVSDTLTAVAKDVVGSRENQTVAIGKGGENKVHYANISGLHGHSVSRTGLGCVMGNKKIKALTVYGTKGIGVAKPKEFKEFTEFFRDELYKHIAYDDFDGYLGDGQLPKWAKDGAVVYGNFEPSEWPQIWKASENASQWMREHFVRSVSCFGCPMRCRDFVKDSIGSGGIHPCQGTWLTIIPRTKIETGEGMWKFYQRVLEYGLDSNEATATVAFMIDMLDRKLITTKQTKGVRPHFGNADEMVEVLDLIAERKGVGNVLADGPVAAARTWGLDPDKYLHHSKGVTLWSHDARSFKGQLIGSAISDTRETKRNQTSIEMTGMIAPEFGKQAALEIFGDEVAGDPNAWRLKGNVVWTFEDFVVGGDIMGICLNATPHFDGPIKFAEFAKLYSYATGKEITMEEFRDYTLRVRTMSRLFNIKMGRRKEDDVLSKSTQDPVIGGPQDGQKLDVKEFEEQREEYYKLRKWDTETGFPTRKMLEKLDMKKYADDIEKYRPK